MQQVSIGQKQVLEAFVGSMGSQWDGGGVFIERGLVAFSSFYFRSI